MLWKQKSGAYAADSNSLAGNVKLVRMQSPQLAILGNEDLTFSDLGLKR